MNENNRFEEMVLSILNELRQDVSTLKTDVGWIKGKLEGTQEGKASVWQIVTTATAVGAVIIALIALLK